MYSVSAVWSNRDGRQVVQKPHSLVEETYRMMYATLVHWPNIDYVSAYVPYACGEYSSILCHGYTECWESVHCMCTFRLTRCSKDQPYVWNMMHVQRTNLYEDCTKDQFMMHVKRTNPMGDTACSYTLLCRVSSEGFMSRTNQLYGNSTCT